MKSCQIALIAAAALLPSVSISAEGESKTKPPEPQPFTSALKSLSKGVVILTEEIRALQKDNQEIRGELREIKSQLRKQTPASSESPAKVKSPGLLEVEREFKAQHDREAESADSVFQAFEYQLSKLRSQRLSVFSDMVSVEMAGIEAHENMRTCRAAVAENLEIEDEELRKAREERLREAYKQAQQAHAQLMERVEALNAELSVVEKKIAHLEQRVKEARRFSPR